MYTCIWSKSHIFFFLRTIIILKLKFISFILKKNKYKESESARLKYSLWQFNVWKITFVIHVCTKMAKWKRNLYTAILIVYKTLSSESEYKLPNI